MQSKASDKSVRRIPAKPRLSKPKPCDIFQVKPISNVAQDEPYNNHFVILKIMVENIDLSDCINIVHKFLIKCGKC